MQEATIDRPRRLPAIVLPALDAPRLCLGLFCIAFVALSLLGSTDPDYWWHERTGQLIVETRSIPQTDPYSWTREGSDWIAHEWLSEVVIYGVEAVGGYSANVLLFTALSIGALLAAYGIAVSLGVSRWVAVALFGYCAMLSFAYWTVRPQVFTWLFFAAFIAICLEHYRGERSRLWLLPLLMVPWANLHGGHVFGIGVVGLYAISLGLERLVWREVRDLKPVLLALAGCVGATLLTPNPIELLLYPITYLKPGNASLQIIAEWQSPNFHEGYYLALAIAIGALIGLGVFSRTRGLFLPLLAIALTILALQSVRNQPLFAIVFLIVAGVRIADHWRWATAGHGLAIGQARTFVNVALLLFAGLIAAAALSKAPGVQLASSAPVDGGFAYPREGVEYIRASHADARLFNDYDWGGYLIHELYPTTKVYVDGRADVYGDDFLEEYIDIVSLTQGWQGVLDQRGVEVMLVRNDSPLAERLAAEHETWFYAFGGDVEAVFVRIENRPE